jgi:hypothetical protein
LKAAKSYEVDSTPTLANSMLIKWCDMELLLKHYDEVSMSALIKAYEKIGNKYL